VWREEHRLQQEKCEQCGDEVTDREFLLFGFHFSLSPFIAARTQPEIARSALGRRTTGTLSMHCRRSLSDFEVVGHCRDILLWHDLESPRGGVFHDPRYFSPRASHSLWYCSTVSVIIIGSIAIVWRARRP
jgi:hypothetical protein